MAPATSSPRQLACSERGSASIEFAASAIVFFMTLVGLMKLCLAVYTFHFVSEAAREGARYAMVRGSSCTPVGSACPAAPADIQTYVQGLSYPGISPAAETVTTTYSAYPTGYGCTPSSSCNNPGNLATVKVAYTFPLSIPFMAKKSYTMTSTAAVVISQ